MNKETTFHGLRHIGMSRSFVWNMFWGVAFGLAAFLCAQSLYGSVALYLSAPITSVVHIVRESTHQLPQNVKVCTPYVWDQRKVNFYRISPQLLTAINLIFENDYLLIDSGTTRRKRHDEGFLFRNGSSFDYPFQSRPPTTFIDENFPSFMEETLAEYKNIMDDFELGTSTFDNLIDKILFTCEDLVESCSLSGWQRVDCCRKIQIDLEYGLYFGDISANTTLLDKDWIRMVLKVPPTENVAPFHHRSDARSIPGSIPFLEAADHGGDLFVTPTKTKPDYLRGLFQTGHHYVVGVLKKRYKMMSRDGYDCDPSAEAEDYRKMTQCFRECDEYHWRFCPTCLPYTKYGKIISANSSINTFYPFLRNSLCSPWEAVNCSNTRRDSESLLGVVDDYEYCIKYCFPPCRQTAYQFHIQSSELDRNTLGFLKKSIPDLERFTETRLVVDFAFSSDEIIVISQEYSLTIDQLLGMIGGLIAFWLGGSILSFLHVATYALGCVNSKPNPAEVEPAPV